MKCFITFHLPSYLTITIQENIYPANIYILIAQHFFTLLNNLSEKNNLLPQHIFSLSAIQALVRKETILISAILSNFVQRKQYSVTASSCFSSTTLFHAKIFSDITLSLFGLSNFGTLVSFSHQFYSVVILPFIANDLNDLPHFCILDLQVDHLTNNQFDSLRCIKGPDLPPFVKLIQIRFLNLHH